MRKEVSIDPSDRNCEGRSVREEWRRNLRFIVGCLERLERGGPCWLLKLRWMGTQRVQMKGVLPWLVHLGLSCRYKRLLSCLGCSGQPSTKYFFLSPYTISILCVPIAQQPGQAVVQGRMCVCGLTLRPQKSLVAQVMKNSSPSSFHTLTKKIWIACLRI